MIAVITITLDDCGNVHTEEEAETVKQLLQDAFSGIVAATAVPGVRHTVSVAVQNNIIREGDEEC